MVLWNPGVGWSSLCPRLSVALTTGRASRGGVCVDGVSGDGSPQGDVLRVGHAGGGGGRIAPRALRCHWPGKCRASLLSSHPSSAKGLGEPL